jgi:hypothetical protein
MRPVRALMTWLAALALALVSPAAAQGSSTTVEIIPISGSLTNACPPTGPIIEGIEFTATIHAVTHLEQREDGTFHISGSLQYVNGSGIGDTGTHYRIINGGQNHFLITGEGAINGTATVRTLLVSQGGMSNTVLLNTLHIVQTPDGEMRTVIDDHRIICT